MTAYCLLTIILLQSNVGGAVSLGRASRDTPIESALVRSPERDGHNALYILLRLVRDDVRYDQITRALMVPGPKSLLDLKVAATEQGIPASIRRHNGLQSLRSVLPAIVPYDAPGDPRGTFLLVFALDIDNGNVDYINGGIATFDRMGTELFLRNWTGHALSVRRPSENTSSRIALTQLLPLAVGSGCVLFLVLYAAIRFRQMKKQCDCT